MPEFALGPRDPRRIRSNVRRSADKVSGQRYSIKSDFGIKTYTLQIPEQNVPLPPSSLAGGRCLKREEDFGPRAPFARRPQIVGVVTCQQYQDDK
jgi:hypothetical protein